MLSGPLLPVPDVALAERCSPSPRNNAVLRAQDAKDGSDLWTNDTKVRTGGTPMTHRINSKRYIAIAVGSGSDASLIVFAL